MVEIKSEELRQLQMEILDYVDDFCRKHNIKYTISGGTLLGAVRHGGYIPWDDDIDIQMLRSEYIRFAQSWKGCNDNHPYEFISIETGNSLGYPFGKVSNPKTVTYVDGVERTGVFIDVFPVDKVADMEDFEKRHKKIRRLYFRQMLSFAWKRRKSGNYPLWKKICAFFVGSWQSREKLAVRINDLAAKKENMDCPLVFEMIAGAICKTPMPIQVFESYTDRKFEDRTYMAVSDFDTYLTKTFGDYMTLPPEEKRIAHHENTYYWK
ncbi:MAG: LicD family protein [Prevotella sp.]|nr:LicD family protein [Prevotella sp.]